MQRAQTLATLYQHKKEKEKLGGERRRYSMAIFFVVQVLILVFFSIFTRHTNTAAPERHYQEYIAFSSDYIHYSNLMIMTIIGYTLSYVSSATGGTSSGMIHAAAAFLTLQWGILVFEFWNRVSSGDFDHTYHLDIESLADGCYATITVLISLGCVNGQISIVQSLWSSLFQVVFYAFNHFLLSLLNISKWERNIYVHLFGVVYGLGMMIGLRPCVHASVVQQKKVGNDFTSKFALLGTLITVVTFPSFNAAFQPVEFQSRVVCNTYLALASGIVCSFAASVILSPEAQFKYEKIRSGILASGVAICGSIAPLCGPAAAAGVGLVASMSGLLVDHFANEMLVDVSNTLSSHFIGGTVVGVFGSVIAAASVDGDGSFFGLEYDDYFDSKSNTPGNYVAAFFVTVFVAFVPSFIISLTLGMGGCSPKKNFTCFEDMDVLSDYDWMMPKTRSFKIKQYKKKESLLSIIAVILGFKDPYADSEVGDAEAQRDLHVTLSEFERFNTYQLESFFMKNKLEYAARLVLRDSLIGSDIVSVEGPALEKYFGITSKMHIEVLIGKMRQAESVQQN